MKTAKPNFRVSPHDDVSKDEEENRTEFDMQCSMLLPPDPQTLAQHLFQFWEERLNFYEDIHRTKNGTFILETLNELANITGNATPYRPQNENGEAIQDT